MIDDPIPHGAAYPGATAEVLREVKRREGDKYVPTAFNPKTRVSGGLARIGKDRVPAEKSDGQPGFNMFYEVHGTGPTKIAFIVGLNNSCHGWMNEVEEFGNDPHFSVLVFDNRGFSNSASPKMRYTTTDMADDLLDLLDYIGWTDPRSVNVVGVSMGGMIALEFCRRHPERVAGALLQSTSPGNLHNLPPFRGLVAFSMAIGSGILGLTKPEDRALLMIRNMFPRSWLEAPSAKGSDLSNEDSIFNVCTC